MPEYKGIEFDQALMAGRAIRPQDYDDERKATWNKAIANGAPIPPLYPGHIVRKCEICQIDVQIGPRQQEALKEHPRAYIVCLVDVGTVLEDMDGKNQVSLVNLGNPHKEK